MAKQPIKNVERETSVEPVEQSEDVNKVPGFVSIDEKDVTKVEEPELPEVVSLSIVRIKHMYALATITTKGKKVVDIQYGEPGGFRFAFEDFKIASMKEFYDKGA